MGAQKLSLGKRLVAGLGTFAMASLAVFGAGTAAHADTITNGNIDVDAEGSITVHKHEQPNVAGEPATGAPQNVDSPALDGVEFSLERVTNIDLSDPAQWDQIEDLTPADVAGDLELVEGPVETVNGQVAFDDLPIGVYLVTEGDDNGDNNIVRKAEPFLVIIPTSIDDTWTYDLHVYPKNSVTALEKELDAEADDNAYAPGDTVAWNVSSEAPQLAPNDELNRFSFVDEIDERLDFTGVSNFTYNGDAWTQDEHYTVTEDGKNVTIELTEAGRAAIVANSGGDLAYTINTTIAEGADIGDGVITNDIIQFTTVNDQDHEVETPEAETYWGSVVIQKEDADNDNRLEGAEFQIFRSQADADAGTNPISIDGVETFITNDDGLIEIGPLNAGAENSRNYYLVEVTPPAGYQADETVRTVEITAGVATENIVIDNDKQPDFDLPLTGAAGTGLFMVIGLALLALGGGLYARNRKANV
ncbi:SpaH/EbpB family LPXTG-anchored major pilin [Yaniella flava]|uniref:SpaH/EbpB family LPXTG-anchored major pilin n=1 Tax=Yaniella flava TaxID=287930 RepID=A0ABP5G1S3_9MICC